MPGASEWGSLARVRRGVRKTFPQRRPPGGPNKDSCRGTCGGRASTSGRCATAANGAGAVRGPKPRRINGTAMKAEVGMAIDAKAAGQEALAAAERCARSGKPTTCSTPAPSPSPRSHQPLARVAAARCGRAPQPRRSSDEAPPWQRGPAGRRCGAEGEGERREDGMEQAFESEGEGNISLQGCARAGWSATTVPAGARDRCHATPGAARSAPAPALTRRAVARRAASQSQAGVTAAPSPPCLDTT